MFIAAFTSAHHLSLSWTLRSLNHLICEQFWEWLHSWGQYDDRIWIAGQLQTYSRLKNPTDQLTKPKEAESFSEAKWFVSQWMNSPTFFRIPTSITVFTAPRHLSLYRASCIHSTPFHFIPSRPILILISLYSFLWRCDPMQVTASSFTRFLDHTQRRTTFSRTPLDEWSPCRRDSYLTTYNTHNRQTSMPPVGFEPTISAGERPQTYASDRAATGTGWNKILK